MAVDQRYCLECGERRLAMSSVLAGGPPVGAGGGPAARPPRGDDAPLDASWQRGNTLTVIAGVGVLLLAMGVGVLIGRSGASRPAAAPQQVISVATTPAAGASTSTGEATFTDSWPSGTSGFTVQLQTLPVAGTTAGAVEAAMSAASAKGATGVGALKSADFSSLPPGHYVVYSGVFHKKSEAEKALSALKRSFPAATVIAVSNRSSGAAGGRAGASGGVGGAGSSLSKPAPPTVLQNLSKKRGKSYEQESKNLPNQISTG
jgi:hypothetical protein